MKRFLPLLLLVLPVALFAQSTQAPLNHKDQETAMLKRFGLNDTQITQVFDIQSRTLATMEQDRVQVRLLDAEMAKALLPANPNMQDVNGFITQIAQTRADLMKAMVSARVQLRQIIGDDNFPAFTRYIMQDRGNRARGPAGMNRPMMGGDGRMMMDGLFGG